MFRNKLVAAAHGLTTLTEIQNPLKGQVGPLLARRGSGVAPFSDCNTHM